MRLVAFNGAAVRRQQITNPLALFVQQPQRLLKQSGQGRLRSHGSLQDVKPIRVAVQVDSSEGSGPIVIRDL